MGTTVKIPIPNPAAWGKRSTPSANVRSGVIIVHPHDPNGVLLVYAEDAGYSFAVGLFQIVGEMAGDGLGTRLQREHALEVLRPVLLVGDFAPEVVALAGVGSVAGRAHVDDDA